MNTLQRCRILEPSELRHRRLKRILDILLLLGLSHSCKMLYHLLLIHDGRRSHQVSYVDIVAQPWSSTFIIVIHHSIEVVVGTSFLAFFKVDIHLILCVEDITSLLLFNRLAFLVMVFEPFVLQGISSWNSIFWMFLKHQWAELLSISTQVFP